MPDWRDEARCVGEDPELFFPEIGPGVNPKTFYKAPKLVCSRCPVILECAQWALDNNVRFGVFGGLDPSERHHIRQGRRRLHHGGDPRAS